MSFQAATAAVSSGTGALQAALLGCQGSSGSARAVFTGLIPGHAGRSLVHKLLWSSTERAPPLFDMVFETQAVIHKEQQSHCYSDNNPFFFLHL